MTEPLPLCPITDIPRVSCLRDCCKRYVPVTESERDMKALFDRWAIPDLTQQESEDFMRVIEGLR